MTLQPALPQVACFDTAFHRSQNRLAQHYALPRALTAAGIKRYGFHGLSYELFVYRAAREIGSLASALRGLDALVFTAGIGEHAHPMRARICEQLEWLGVMMDDAANRVGAGMIHHPRSRVRVCIIPTNEEAVIARHTARVAGLFS
jgi:acetate kinase